MAEAFPKPGGRETVLLLARRTPLPSDTQLGSLLKSAPQNGDPDASSYSPDLAQNVSLIKVTPASTQVSVLQNGKLLDDQAEFSSESLQVTLDRLRAHFELIQAVQFSHKP